MKPRPTSWIQRIRVPLGFAFAAVFAFLSRPNLNYLWYGTAIALLGLLLRIWAAGYLHKHQELCVAGPYRWTRNPLYLGSLLLGIGFSVASASLWVFLLFVSLFFTIYIPVMLRENEELIQAYGSEYEDYRKQVPAFLPALRPYPFSAKGNFRLHQVILNREYQAILGFLTVFAFLLVKLKWL